MKILAIDTSCDETAAVTEDTRILSNIIWSQASQHAKFGGVLPSLAQRMHEERIGFVVNKALVTSKQTLHAIDAIAVTVGPGLSIALGVGVNFARDLAIKHNKKLIAVNHLEGHVLSPFAKPKSENSRFQIPDSRFPKLGLVISGANTLLVKINKVGSYETLVTIVDDALGEALDKAARMLGLGYPGGAILEKFSKLGDPKIYRLPIPIIGQEERRIFTYSGLKTAMYRLVEKEKPLTKEKIYNLAASFQDTAFSHLIRVVHFVLANDQRLPAQVGLMSDSLLVGGGVAANVEVRKRLRKLAKAFGVKIYFPYTKKLYGDNAGMIGLAAYLNPNYINPNEIDRNPNLKIGG